MSVLMRAREVHGRPVVTLDTAEDVAEVKDVVFSHAEGAVAGVTLNKRGRLSGPAKEVLRWANVAALGRDAVMIENRDALETQGQGILDAESGQGDVIGARVTTDSGKDLGEVVDVIIDVAGGRASLVGFEIKGPAVERDTRSATLMMPAGETIAVSSQALIVPGSAEEFVQDDLSGFASAVAEFRARLREGAPS